MHQNCHGIRYSGSCRFILLTVWRAVANVECRPKQGLKLICVNKGGPNWRLGKHACIYKIFCVRGVWGPC